MTRTKRAEGNVVLRAKQAAAYLNMSVDTLYKYANDGRLPGFQLNGGHWRFRRDELDEWMRRSSRRGVVCGKH